MVAVMGPPRQELVRELLCIRLRIDLSPTSGKQSTNTDSSWSTELIVRAKNPVDNNEDDDEDENGEKLKKNNENKLCAKIEQQMVVALRDSNLSPVCSKLEHTNRRDCISIDTRTILQSN